MAKKHPDIWYRFFKEPFKGNEPGYFEVASEPWVKEMEQNFEVIKQEITEFIKEDVALLKDYRFHISHGRSQWQTFSLQSWGFKHRSHIQRLPTTWGIFKKMDGIVSVSVSRLVANNIIPAHYGDTNAIYRCHYGIKVPAGRPDCCFVVEGEEREWKEGKVLAFCDARNHYARNLTSEDRYVIIFDRIRDEYADSRYQVCSTIIATHFLYALDLKLGFYKKAPAWLLRFLMMTLTPVANCFLRAQDFILG